MDWLRKFSLVPEKCVKGLCEMETPSETISKEEKGVTRSFPRGNLLKNFQYFFPIGNSSLFQLKLYIRGGLNCVGTKVKTIPEYYWKMSLLLRTKENAQHFVLSLKFMNIPWNGKSEKSWKVWDLEENGRMIVGKERRQHDTILFNIFVIIVFWYCMPLRFCSSCTKENATFFSSSSVGMKLYKRLLHIT